MKQEKKWKMVSSVRVVELIYPISSHPGTRDTSANLTIKKMCRNADMRRGPTERLAIGSTEKLCSLLTARCLCLNGCAEKHWDCQVSRLASSSTARWNLHPPWCAFFSSCCFDIEQIFSIYGGNCAWGRRQRDRSSPAKGSRSRQKHFKTIAAPF